MAQVGDDCYFFYYSSCSKGSSCPFRHVEAALGSEVMCTHWQAGTCTRPGCRYRHFEIKVDRSSTPCYWETQPSGCTKPHCVFKHFKKQDIDILPTIEEIPSRAIKKLVYKARSSEMEVPSILTATQQEVDRASPRIEPVVVNPFEDDSDADSAIGTPQKKAVVARKTIPPKADKTDVITATSANIVVAARKPVVVAKSKCKIKMLDPDPNEQLGITASLSDNMLFEESSSRRNVIISDSGESDTGKSFHDLLKKSKSSLGLVTAPAKQTGVKASVKNRLGQTNSVPGRKSPSKLGVKSRLGLDSSSDRLSPVMINIKDRLGDGSEDVVTSRVDVKSRLGGSSSQTSLGLKSLTDLRAQKLAIQKQLEEDSNEDDDVSNIKIKSLEEIRADKAKKAQLAEKSEANKKGWRTNVKTNPPAKSAPKRKIITYTELFEETATEMNSSPKEEPEVKVKSLKDIRIERPIKKKPVVAKKERQIYMPPARKSSEDTNNLNLKKAVTVKRTITPPPKEDVEMKVAKVSTSGDVKVKTFSEIMAEKRRKQMEFKSQNEVENNTNNPKPKVRITPIVFSSNDKDETDIPKRNLSASVKQTVSVAPLRNKNVKLKENVSSVNESISEPKNSGDNRLSEGHVLSDNNGCDNTKCTEQTISREELPPIKPSPLVEGENTTVESPPKKRSSSQGSDIPSKKKSRQSLNITEDDDDFFFGTDLDDLDDGGKIDDGDLLQDIDELLA